MSRCVEFLRGAPRRARRRMANQPIAYMLFQVPHPLAAILALTQLMEVSTGKLPPLTFSLEFLRSLRPLTASSSIITGIIALQLLPSRDSSPN